MAHIYEYIVHNGVADTEGAHHHRKHRIPRGMRTRSDCVNAYDGHQSTEDEEGYVYI